MSHKTWLTKDAWVGYASCGGDSRFLVPPDKLSDDDIEDIQAVCHRCRVRPECLRHCLDGGDTGVWTASAWLPEASIDDTKSEAYAKLDEAERIREELAGTIEDELKRRGEF